MKYIFRFNKGRIKSFQKNCLELKNIQVRQLKEQSYINSIYYCERKAKIPAASIVEEDISKAFVFIIFLKITCKKNRNNRK